jgi:hypothetical protein
VIGKKVGYERIGEGHWETPQVCSRQKTLKVLSRRSDHGDINDLRLKSLKSIEIGVLGR